MTLAVGNKPRVAISYELQPRQSLALSHDGDDLDDYGNALFVELQSPPAPPSCTLTFTDASGGDVYAWTVDRTLSAWPRGTGECSITVESMDHDVLVVHVPTGVNPPSDPSASGPPAPGTSQTVVRIKVKDQGSLPLD